MPVEVGELIIRSKVTTSDSNANINSTSVHANTDGSSAFDSSPFESSRINGASSASSDKDAIVQECVRQVLRILKKKEER